MISPTGKGIRQYDKWGGGWFGAPRGENKIHNGADFICVPGQIIVAPFSGMIIREARPYAEGDYSGVLIRGTNIEATLFYLAPDRSLIGHYVTKGQDIGRAQDISEKYSEMTPHVHFRIIMMDPALLLNMP